MEEEGNWGNVIVNQKNQIDHPLTPITLTHAHSHIQTHMQTNMHACTHNTPSSRVSLSPNSHWKTQDQTHGKAFPAAALNLNDYTVYTYIISCNPTFIIKGILTNTYKISTHTHSLDAFALLLRTFYRNTEGPKSLMHRVAFNQKIEKKEYVLTNWKRRRWSNTTNNKATCNQALASSGGYSSSLVDESF